MYQKALFSVERILNFVQIRVQCLHNIITQNSKYINKNAHDFSQIAREWIMELIELIECVYRLVFKQKIK